MGSVAIIKQISYICNCNFNCLTDMYDLVNGFVPHGSHNRTFEEGRKKSSASEKNLSGP